MYLDWLAFQGFLLDKCIGYHCRTPFKSTSLVIGRKVDSEVEECGTYSAGQKAAMKKLVDNYDLNTAPAINVPKLKHIIKGPNGKVSRRTKVIVNLRRILPRDTSEIRRVFEDIPNATLKGLIE